MSPVFVKGDTLYIPASFVAWTGAALDEKTPLLRSQNAINEQGLRLLRHLGDTDAQQVVSNVGWEQEFFFVDREMWLQRPDLIASGRTLLGAEPPRGQQLSTNYFTRVQPRIKACLDDWCNAQIEAGICSAVFHNEVAPGQHEQSPVFSLTNVASDQNILAMEMLNDIASDHNLVALYHEKPFAGINGSGKHSNWGLNTDTGKNLYAPGKTSETQADFTAFVTALTHAITQHADVLRCSIATAGNDHRLGAQEAPPAILSLYTGVNMEAKLKGVAFEGADLACYAPSGKEVDYGCTNTAPIVGAEEDRNRTAPIPFCGNRFEFRAVGSSQNISYPLAILNSAVAESMGVLADAIEGGKSPRDAVADMLKEHWAIIFNGDGYSDEWPVEAASRGLPNLRNTVDAVETLNSEKNQKLFESQGVFTPTELAARQEIMFEKYTNDIFIEANCLLDMMETGVLPACAKDLKNYAGSDLGSKRAAIYKQLEAATEDLQEKYENLPDDSPNSQA